MLRYYPLRKKKMQRVILHNFITLNFITVLKAINVSSEQFFCLNLGHLQAAFPTVICVLSYPPPRLVLVFNVSVIV